ncbi:hypothetical protein MES5069_280071 [Mesorhizobium escarrei]|uniref:Uncharacterized protein n=1 Tax=Mesorhizobium escarrei TaxID=666018 RepID=A0ABM9DX21_9HYPH|nr:hypothetical protein MES5069_280071 [Mesorhizobium escarrei]
MQGSPVFRLPAHSANEKPAPPERRGRVAWALVAPRYSEHHRRDLNLPNHGEDRINRAEPLRDIHSQIE